MRLYGILVYSGTLVRYYSYSSTFVTLQYRVLRHPFHAGSPRFWPVSIRGVTPLRPPETWLLGLYRSRSYGLRGSHVGFRALGSGYRLQGA